MSASYTKVYFNTRQPDVETAMKLNKLTADLSAAISSAGGGGTPVTGQAIYGEIPSGLINGSNKVYTSVNTYGTGQLAVFLNGVRQRRANDYNETTSTSFTMILAPLSGDSLSIDYIH